MVVLTGEDKGLNSDPLEDSGILKPMLAYVAENWENGNARNQRDIETILISVLMRFFIGSLHYEERDSSYILTGGYSRLTRETLIWIEKITSRNFLWRTWAGR